MPIEHYTLTHIEAILQAFGISSIDEERDETEAQDSYFKIIQNGELNFLQDCVQYLLKKKEAVTDHRVAYVLEHEGKLVSYE